MLLLLMEMMLMMQAQTVALLPTKLALRALHRTHLGLVVVAQQLAQHLRIMLLLQTEMDLQIKLMEE